MTAPRVSVLIPCFNAEEYIGEALDSVLAQTWADLEVIVVDDGSADGSSGVLAQYESRGVRVIRQKHQGQCAAANRAFAASSGELVKFFDADDVMAPDMIQRQVARLGARRDAIAMGEWARFYGDDPAEAVFEVLPMYRDAAPAEWLASEWMKGYAMMQCALWLIPRRILACSGLWDERLSLINDFEFFARVLLNASEILYAPGARLYYRSGLVGSLSGQKSGKAVESAFLSILLGTQHLLDAEDSPRIRRACANIFQQFEYDCYPGHGDLRSKARARVLELGGSDLMPDGPPGFHKLRPILGWRFARRAQLMATLLRLNGASRKSKPVALQ